jgi:ankyrin repeat protein
MKIIRDPNIVLLEEEDSSFKTAKKLGPDHILDLNVTPLMIVCGKGYYEVAEYLLKKGADPNISDVDGWTALMYAVGDESVIAEPEYEEKILQIVNLLLKKGAKASIKSWSDETPSERAEHCNLFKVAEILKEAEEKENKNNKKPDDEEQDSK